MQRSSRSAGVRPSRIMQYTVRSFAISLAIVLVTSPANSFTIRRLEPLAPTSDLETGESSLLEVRYDLQTTKSPTSDLVALKESKTTSTTAKITTHSYIDLVTSTSELPTVNISKKDLNEPKTTILPPVTNSSTTVASTLPFKLESSSIYDQNITSPMTVKITNKQANESELITTETASELSLNYTTTPDNYRYTVNSTKAVAAATGDSITIQYNDSQDNTTENIDNLMSEGNNAMGHTFITGVSDDDKALNSTEVLLATPESTSRKFSFEVSSQPVGETVLQLTSNNPVSDFITNTDSTLVTARSPMVNEESFKVTMIDFTTDANDGYLENNLPTTIEVPIVETFNTETIKEEPVTLTLPIGKTHKTIERNATSTERTEETTSSNVRAESARMSLEKVLTNIPITSLMELKNDLISVQENTTRIYENKINVTSPSNLETPTIRNISEGVNLQTEKFEVISSKRAGYLDNTETTSIKFEEATTEKYENINNTKDTETFGSMYETEGVEGEVSDVLEVKNVTGLESQSQLVEDAIKEELLMEKTLNENEYLKEKARQIGVKPVLGITPPVLDIIPTIHEVVTEDVLSVKPINIEKKQSIALYSVSPNYKPPKKLDIQPTKQFVRDPDDNTWRNERISSLGIVFKPKNASKSFTEVLKNKTTELSNMSEKNDKNDIPDLRIRLEKIAEVRKSKKKKFNAFGDLVYIDSEESSIDNASSLREEATSPMSPQHKSNLISITSLPSSTTDADVINYIPKENFKMFKEEFATPPTTLKNKLLGDFYDSADDYDADYVTKIDLKKFTTSPKTDPFKPVNVILNAEKFIPVTYMPGRQPTVQYFPPTKKVKTTAKPEANVKVNIDEYDDYFKNKVNQFTYTHQPKMDYDPSFGTASPAHTNKFQHLDNGTTKPHSTPPCNNDEINKNLYLTSQPPVTDVQGGFINNGNINKESYVIKHYKDFIADAAKGNEDDNLPFTVAPIQGVKISELSTQKEQKRNEDYDYNSQFRKDIVNRFVDNFNQNSDRFKVDFPVIYNNSVIHRMIDDNGRVLASSRTFMKRLYDSASPRPNFLTNVKPCDANCESMRVVDLSPAYELHYYVPEQEEKEEIEPRQNVVPYRYRL